jgi:hypothetical protein
LILTLQKTARAPLPGCFFMRGVFIKKAQKKPYRIVQFAMGFC